VAQKVEELGVTPERASAAAVSHPVDSPLDDPSDQASGASPAAAGRRRPRRRLPRNALVNSDDVLGRDVSPRRKGDVLFVEVFRLFLVIAGVIGGLAIGNHEGRHSTAPLIGITLGALITYLAGGIVGRLLDRGVMEAVHELRSMPASEVFAGSVVGTTGLLAGLVAGLPLVALVHSAADYPAVARVSLASPNSSVVFGSKSSSLSMPAKPGRIERLRKTMFSASSALMMGMP
jgi:hypothetical protein